jgi:hypothetical protein
MSRNCKLDLLTWSPSMTDLTSIISCEFEPGPSADAHQYWYSPFDADDRDPSETYQITTGRNIHKLTRADFTGPPLLPAGNVRAGQSPISCLQTLDGPSATASPMCIGVDPNDSHKLSSITIPGADTATDPASCTTAATATDNVDGQWITGATAYAPAGSHDELGQSLPYELRGCELQCTQPDLASNFMVETEVRGVGDNPTASHKRSNFNIKIKCMPGYGPPASDPTNVAWTQGGVPAAVCDTGAEYNIPAQGPCRENCIIPAAGNTQYVGYNFTGLYTGGIPPQGSLNDSVSALFSPLGDVHDATAATAISGAISCAPGYSKDHLSNANSNFMDNQICSSPGSVLDINDQTAAVTDQGCIADCVKSESRYMRWQTTPNAGAGAQILDLPIWGSHSGGGELPDAVPYGDSNVPNPDSLVCAEQSGWVHGPGSDGTKARYLPCGNLPGHTSETNPRYKDNRNKYAIVGCYPACDNTGNSTELCYNYKMERPIVPQVVPVSEPEVAWRNEMGQLLTKATEKDYATPLDASNISFVHRQVINDGPIGDPTYPNGKEIFEWQVKCSSPQCSDDAESGSPIINPGTLLGTTGIPQPADWTGSDCDDWLAAGHLNDCAAGMRDRGSTDQRALIPTAHRFHPDRWCCVEAGGGH